MVKTLPSNKKAPGRNWIVAVYTDAYIGAYTNGTKDSATPNKEFNFPLKKKKKCN